MAKIFTAVLFIFTLIFCDKITYAQSNFWVIGGQEADEGQYPWMVDFRRVLDGNEKHLCGAALIHPYWILTASHCFRLSRPEYGAAIALRVNSINTGSSVNPNGGVVAEIDSIFDNALFSLDQKIGAGNDIALIKLKTPIYSIAPISLPKVSDTSGSIYAGNRSVKAAGWGLTDSLGNEGAEVLQWVATKIIDNNLCQQYYRDNEIVGQLSNGVICAGFDDSVASGVGAGDSGGPLWTDENGEEVLIGIVSGGGGQRTTIYKEPGIFTKVAFYRPWIDSIITGFTPDTDTSGSFDDRSIIVSTETNGIKVAFKHVKSEKIVLQFYNIEGKQMYKCEMSAPAYKTINIDTQHFASGIYILRIYDNENKLFTKKMHYLAY